MRNYTAKDVDAYISNSDPKARPHLTALRKLIRSTAPDAEEKISWGIPFYWYHGALVGFAAFKNHVGFGFAFALQDEDRRDFGQEGYLTGKKTVQIKFEQKIPAALLGQILKFRVENNISNQYN